MDWIDSFISNGQTPWVTAALLGFINAVSHCLLATNIAAICFITKEMKSPRKIFMNGIYYLLGRTFTYVVLAFIVLSIIQRGSNLEIIQEAMGHYGDMLMGPLLLLAGVIMLFADRISLPSVNIGVSHRLEAWARKSYFGSFILGVVLALAFCPTSAFLFFGMLIPLSASSSEGILLPLIFAITTALPVVVAIWILVYSYSKLNLFFDKMQLAGKWFRITVSCILILTALYLLFSHHEH